MAKADKSDVEYNTDKKGRSIKEIRENITSINHRFKAGDYVLACKFSDGGMRDPWVVDFIKEVKSDIGNGKPGIFFEQTGVRPFKFAVNITDEEGRKILRYWKKQTISPPSQT